MALQLGLMLKQLAERDKVRMNILLIRKNIDSVMAQLDTIVLPSLAKCQPLAKANRDLDRLLTAEIKAWQTLRLRVRDGDEVGIKDAVYALAFLSESTKDALVTMLAREAA